MLLFPEGPRWRDGRLWFSDIHGHRVMTVDGEAAGRPWRFFRPSAVGFALDGTPLVVDMLGRPLQLRVPLDRADLDGAAVVGVAARAVADPPLGLE